MSRHICIRSCPPKNMKIPKNFGRRKARKILDEKHSTALRRVSVIINLNSGRSTFFYRSACHKRGAIRTSSSPFGRTSFQFRPRNRAAILLSSSRNIQFSRMKAHAYLERDKFPDCVCKRWLPAAFPRTRRGHRMPRPRHVRGTDSPLEEKE